MKQPKAQPKVKPIKPVTVQEALSTLKKPGAPMNTRQGQLQAMAVTLIEQQPDE